MSNIRYKMKCRQIWKDYIINKEKYQKWMDNFEQIFQQYNLKDCRLVFVGSSIGDARFSKFEVKPRENIVRIQIYLPKVCHVWEQKAIDQTDSDSYKHELEKYMKTIIDHEYRHYQQYKYLINNGFDWKSYCNRVQKIEYDDRFIEIDARIYAEDRKELLIDNLGLDYYITWIDELKDQLSHENDSETKHTLLTELWQVVDEYSSFKDRTKIKAGDMIDRETI